MKKLLTCGLLFSVWSLSFNLAAQTVHISHCLMGCPLGTSATNELIVRHLYAVSINTQTRVADWISYRVLNGSIGVASLLPREWHDDELTQSGFTSDDFSEEQVGTIDPDDRGRLVPMTGFANTSYWSDLNLYSVMSPIKPDLRLGALARFDQAVNRYARQNGEAYILMGPIYAEPGTSLQEANMPTAYFKIVASVQGAMSTFIFDQNLAVHANYCSQRSDLGTIESLTGLELFPQAEDWPGGSLDSQLGC